MKALVLFAVLSALPEDGLAGPAALAWTVIVGALLWSGVQRAGSGPASSTTCRRRPAAAARGA